MPVPSDKKPNLLTNLRRILRQVTRDPKPKVVHQLRTTIRRTEALWQAHRLETSGKSRALARQFAKLRRRAGKVRDLDVQLQLLDSVNIGGRAGAKDRLERALEDKRRSQEKKLLGELDGKGLKKLLKRMSSLHATATNGNLVGSASAQIGRDWVARLHLAQEILEAIQFNSTQTYSRRRQFQDHAPKFFSRAVQRNQDDAAGSERVSLGF